MDWSDMVADMTDKIYRKLYISKRGESMVAEIDPPIEGCRIAAMTQTQIGTLVELAYDNVSIGGSTLPEPEWVQAMAEHTGFPASATLRFMVFEEQIVYLEDEDFTPSERRALAPVKNRELA